MLAHNNRLQQKKTIRQPNALLQLIALALGAVMAILDVTAVNVALNSIDNDLKIGMSGIMWVADGYTFAYAALLFLGAAFSTRYGSKLTYLCGLTIFLIASAFCAIAPNGTFLILARLLQGVGAAIFTPSALSSIADNYRDRDERSKAMSRWISIVSIAAVLGPLLSGILIHINNWRLIFLVNVPIGIVALFLTSHYVQKGIGKSLAKINPASHAMLAICLGSICFSLIEGARLGWTSLPIDASAFLAFASAIVLFKLESRSLVPIFPVTLLSKPGYVPALAAFTALSLTFYGQLFVVSIMMQKEMAYSPLDIGIRLLPAMAIISPANLASGYLSRRVGINFSCSVGLIISIVGALLLIKLEQDSSPWLFIVGMVLANLGNGLTAPALTLAIMHRAIPDYSDIASGMLNFGRQIGVLLGIAFMGIIIGTISEWNKSYITCFTFVILVHLITFALVLFIPSGEEPQAWEAK
ncbi:MFS transporter [Sodalis ligni]|uniref:MFS transporter n=1 Tax=Sodalis ligni TaxID=2697027 RepID=UPI00193ED4CB|nr:MFS transporter [Sodalis ligni]QWA09114.1 MFS transporter [Sodalis ligni]